MPQLKRIAAILLFLCSATAWGSIGGRTAFEVRTTGNNNNGGCFDPNVTSPGTDFSQQDTAQVAFTDLVIGATTTQLTSAANPFSSASVGNCIQIISGTGFTVGTYEVISVTGSTATMDRSVGTASSTGGTGNLGGALNTFTQALKAINQGGANCSCTVWVKAGTWTLTTQDSTANATINSVGNITAVIAYQTTRGDNASNAVFTTATNSTTLFQFGQASGGLIFKNLTFTSTATTKASGLISGSNSSVWTFINCTFDGFLSAINTTLGTVNFVRSVVKNSTSFGAHLTITSTATVGSYYSLFINNGSDGLWVSSGGSVGIFSLGSIYANNSGSGINSTVNNNSNILTFIGNDFVSNTGSGILLLTSSTTNPLGLYHTNNIYYGNGAYGITAGSASNPVVQTALLNRNNAFGANATAPRLNLPVGTGDITLTGNPFTNSAAGDFSLNATAGAGALAKQAGYPGVFPDGNSTGFADIGALQSNVGGGTTIINMNAGSVY